MYAGVVVTRPTEMVLLLIHAEYTNFHATRFVKRMAVNAMYLRGRARQHRGYDGTCPCEKLGEWG